MTFQLKTYSKKMLADTITPVNIYLKLRDIFAGSILLESSDYHGHENSLSFICCDPIATFQVHQDVASLLLPGQRAAKVEIKKGGEVTGLLEEFKNSFKPDHSTQSKYPHDGLF